MHVTKGRNLLASGDEQGALVELLRANEIDPSNEAAQQEIAKIRARHGQEPAVESSAPMSAQTEEADVEAIGSPAQLKPMSNEPSVCCTCQKIRSSCTRPSARLRASTFSLTRTTFQSASRLI